MTLNNTAENNAKVNALKAVKETQWVGNLTFENIETCLRSMSMNTMNSGWYNPKALRIAGLQGIYMINEDGGLYFEQRIIKVSNNEYRVESLSNSGFNVFENKYLELVD